MSVREAIRVLRERRKDLEVRQREAKGSRKGCPREEMPELWESIRRRSIEITALLNLHHELRGSEHRHVVAPTDEYLGRKYTEEFMKKLSVTV